MVMLCCNVNPQQRDIHRSPRERYDLKAPIPKWWWTGSPQLGAPSSFPCGGSSKRGAPQMVGLEKSQSKMDDLGAKTDFLIVKHFFPNSVATQRGSYGKS